MKKENIVSYKYLILFVIFVVVVIVGTIIVKVFTEITSSSFRNNAFSVLYVAPESKLIYVDKAAKKVLFLAIGDIRELVKGKNNIAASLVLGLPVNAMIVDENPPVNISEFSDAKNEMRLMFGNESNLKYMNRYDVHKFIGAMRSSIKDNRVERRIDLTNKNHIADIEEYFKDSSINNAPYTIQIDNGTSINGLGNDLAKVLSREGFNVIAVRTARRALTSYIASPTEKNSYIDSLMGLTGFEYKQEKVSQAADITIFLGDDIEALLLP